MKKITLILALLVLGLGLHAQVDSAALIQAQQQQQMLSAQQQDLAQQQALIDKQMKQAKKAERRERIGRKGRLAIAPAIGFGTWSFDETQLYFGANFALAANATWHQPIARKWNLDFGLGYQWNEMMMYNNAIFNEATQLLEPYTPQTWGREENYFSYSTIELPLLLGRVFQDGSELYLGLRLGYRFLASYHRDFFVEENGLLDDEDTDTPVGFGKNNQLNRFSCKVVLGTEDNGFLFAPGCELYFDLVPTMRQFPSGQQVFMNEWGVRINL